jgi:hypothetical protein
VDVEATYLVRHLVSRLVGEIHHTDPGAFFGETPGRLAAYSTGASGHDGDFSIQASWHV